MLRLMKFITGTAGSISLVRRISAVARRRAHDLFMQKMQPRQSDRILDIGTSDDTGIESNMLEQLYPCRKNIICASRHRPMKTLFLLVQVTTGLMAVAALLILLAIVLLRSSAAFAKESAGALGYVAALLTSGFTKGTAPKAAGWVVAWPQAGLALLFVAMLVTLFLPGAKIFLHLVAALAAVAVVWYVRMLLTEVKLEIFCLPLLAAWFTYYLMCLFWHAHQPMPPVTGP
jgi:hypothetical protein